MHVMRSPRLLRGSVKPTWKGTSIHRLRRHIWPRSQEQDSLKRADRDVAPIISINSER